MLKFSTRENMKIFKRFLLFVLCTLPSVVGAQVATTVGGNLTAYNPTGPSVGNNDYNSMMNVRSTVSGAGATANFGNCNSLILRCAQPKCSGCTSMEIARPIVSGCVNSISECKQYGNDLIEYISGQMVSTVSARIQQQQAAADAAAAQAAAQQSSAEMQALQQQLAQMQTQMAQQNAQSEQIARLQADLDAQRAATASAQQAAADAVAAQAAAQQQAETSTSVTTVSDEQRAAIDAGATDEVLVRQRIGGQILTKVENAEMALKGLKNVMENAFSYAGCDSRGNNCAGPKRVKIFKQKAGEFFDPYAEVVDEMYSALEMALAVGVDVSDVIMMLSGSCNQWGRFLCDTNTVKEGEKNVVKHVPLRYSDGNEEAVDIKNEKLKVGNSCVNGRSVAISGYVKGGHECAPGAAIPPQDDARCTWLELIDASKDGDDAVRREWLDENYDGDRMIRVGCATSALDNIKLFAGRSKARAAMLDIDTLERMLNQDAPEFVTTNKWSNSGEGVLGRTKYCGLTEKGYRNLQNAISNKRLDESKVCVPYDDLMYEARRGYISSVDSSSSERKAISGAGNLRDCRYCFVDGCELNFEPYEGAMKQISSAAVEQNENPKQRGRCTYDSTKCYEDNYGLKKMTKEQCEKIHGAGKYDFNDSTKVYKKKTSS